MTERFETSGRKMPVAFSPELGEEVCMLIAEGYSLRSISRIKGMPTAATVINWCLRDPQFFEQYARARKIQAMVMADEIFDIADDGTNDTQTDEEGNVTINYDHIARSRMRVDLRKWYLGKVFPKVFGPRSPNPPEASQRVVKTVTPDITKEPVQKPEVEKLSIEDIQKLA